MKKLAIIFVCLVLGLMMSFSVSSARNYYYGGHYLKAITPAGAVIGAARDGKDICVYTSDATYCFKFSEISVLFDKNLPSGPGLMTDDNGDYILVFENRKQFNDYVPGMFHNNKLTVLKEWPKKKK